MCGFHDLAKPKPSLMPALAPRQSLGRPATCLNRYRHRNPYLVGLLGDNENLCKLMTLSPAGGGGERLKAATRQFMAMQARFAGADSGSGNFLREYLREG
jgi:hypothetical protein